MGVTETRGKRRVKEGGVKMGGGRKQFYSLYYEPVYPWQPKGMY